MKSQFLQHEYTWSNCCITGNTLGWGITASSTPESKTILHELEKLAALAEPERNGRAPVEELTYSPATGFVRMWTVPAGKGEDGRDNKLVRILQITDPLEKNPCSYFAGLSQWQPESRKMSDLVKLPRLSFEEIEESPDEILKSMGVYDRLPVLLKAVFWSLLEYSGGLDIVASDWDREEFNQNAGRFMYAVHCLLPESLRTKAGYRSYAWQECEGIPFYFSKEELGTACFRLKEPEPAEQPARKDELEEYFYNTLAYCRTQEPDRYQEAMEILSDFLERAGGMGNELRKCQWIFYDHGSRQGENMAASVPLSIDYLITRLPDLIYWSHQDEALKKAAKGVIHAVHSERLSEEQEKTYLEALLEKVSKTGLKMVVKEIIWVLGQMNQRGKESLLQGLILVYEKNLTIYHILRKNLEKKDEWKDAFESMERLGYIDRIQETDRRQKEEETSGHRQELEGEASEDQTESRQPAEKKERKTGNRRKKKPEKDPDSLSGADASYRSIDDAEELVERTGSFPDFLLTGFPFGFMTGCVLFLCHYSLMIGHWKIAVGMGGMWILLILEYIYLLISRLQRRPLWQCLGLGLVEGLLIEIAASMIIDQKIRLYFFIILGVITVAIGLLNIIRARRERKG